MQNTTRAARFVSLKQIALIGFTPHEFPSLFPALEDHGTIFYFWTARSVFTDKEHAYKWNN